MNNEEIITKLQNPDAFKAAQYNLDGDYQRHILAYMLSDRQFLMETVGLIEPNYFGSEPHRLICRIILDYHEKHHKLPSKVIIKQDIQDRIKDEAHALRCIAELGVLYQYYVPGLDSREAIQNRVVKFAKTQALRSAFRKSFELLSQDFESDETWAKIQEVYRQAILVDKKWDLGLDYFNTLEDRYSRMEDEAENAEKFTTGFETVDNSLGGGGMSKGEIYAIMGLSGTGKSLWLVTAAVKNLVAGKKVLYLSCEMSRDKIAERFDAQLANECIWQLKDKKQSVIAAVREYVKDMEDKRQLVIHHFPAGTPDVNSFRSYHAQMKMLGFVPDLVIVDYIGEMKDAPGIKTYESRFRIVRDLRGFATEENFLCLTAMQPNRSARELQEDPTKYIDDDNLADAFGQTRPLDGLWSINQGLKEKKAGVARGFVVKSRSGVSRIDFLMAFNERTLMIQEISKEVYKSRMSLVTEKDADNTGQHFDDV